MSHLVVGSRVLALSMSLLFASPSLHAQEAKQEAQDVVQEGEGVILRVEPVDEKSDPKGAKRVKITVNTAAVWRDYVRDQANSSKTPNSKAGENSIATKGQPESPNTSIIAEVGADTILLSRFRSSTDDASPGSKTVEKAEKKDGSPASDDVKLSLRDDKAVPMKVADLKPGLFVDLSAANGKASKITVLKPVGGPGTPASESEPKK